MNEPKQMFDAFRNWYRWADLDDEALRQGSVCMRFLDSVEMNLPEPGESLIAGACAELHKLEHMLAFPTI